MTDRCNRLEATLAIGSLAVLMPIFDPPRSCAALFCSCSLDDTNDFAATPTRIH
jgi:hypothetical protein